jgi:FlaA1/EpsC-like NDP-sugar epimerase
LSKSSLTPSATDILAQTTAVTSLLGFPAANEIEEGMMRLQAKSAIVTGAGRSIGKAIARRFLEGGTRVMTGNALIVDLGCKGTDDTSFTYP